MGEVMHDNDAALHTKSNKQALEVDFRKLNDLVRDYNKRVSNSTLPNECDVLAKSLENYYFLEFKKHKSFGEKIRDTVKTFTVYPNTSVKDYLKYTTLNLTPNKAIAQDWEKVGNQLWLSYLKLKGQEIDE